jgi:Transposase IS66 family
LQTSDSLRVGEVQIGPEALSMAAVLNKELCLSHERAARVLELGYGLKWSRSGICRALERLGNLAAPTYQQLQSALRQSPVVWVDDTGWRVNARLQNLRVWLSEQITVYVIEPHRGYAEAAAFLGEDYDGFLVHDGARCFYGFVQAFHQSCLEHLIRRCREMIQIASPAAAHSRGRSRGCCNKGSGCAIATSRVRFPRMVWPWPRGGWKHPWTACWIDVFVTRPIDGWPNTCAMSYPICSPFCAVPACRRRITSLSGPFG